MCQRSLIVQVGMDLLYVNTSTLQCEIYNNTLYDIIKTELVKDSSEGLKVYII